MFEVAAELIVQSIHQMLCGYEAQCEAGRFRSDHPELPVVRELIDRAHTLKIRGYEAAEMQAWVRDVADVLPQLWD